jgi:hypothetical protein
VRGHRLVCCIADKSCACGTLLGPMGPRCTTSTHSIANLQGALHARARLRRTRACQIFPMPALRLGMPHIRSGMPHVLMIALSTQPADRRGSSNPGPGRAGRASSPRGNAADRARFSREKERNRAKVFLRNEPTKRRFWPPSPVLHVRPWVRWCPFRVIEPNSIFVYISSDFPGRVDWTPGGFDHRNRKSSLKP